MGFGFNKKKKKKNAENSCTSAVQTTFDKAGNVEIVSKNFKMKTTQKPEETSEAAGDSWVCWGCGQSTTEDACPVCGKKRIK